MFDLTPQTVSEFVEWDDEVIGLGKRLRTGAAVVVGGKQTSFASVSNLPRSRSN